MPKSKQQKNTELEEFRQKIGNLGKGILLFVNYKGLDVAKLSALRRAVRKSGGELKVVKKTLARLAFKDANIPFDPVTLEGEVGFVFGYDDPLSVARLIHQQFVKEKKPTFLGAWFEAHMLDTPQTIALALLPGRQELLAKMVGSIASPMSGLLAVFSQTMAGLVRVLDGKARQ